VLRDPGTRIKECPGNRTMYYLKEINVVVIVDPSNRDGMGTAFPPDDRDKYFKDEDGNEVK
jgi:hypothetical protein